MKKHREVGRNLRPFAKRPKDRSLEPVFNGRIAARWKVQVSIERLSHEVPWTPLLASQDVMAVELQQAKVGAFGRRLRPVPVNLPQGFPSENDVHDAFFDVVACLFEKRLSSWSLPSKKG